MADENNMNIDMAESYEASGVDPFDAPIPGASLTNDPQNPYPWEIFKEAAEISHSITIRK